MVKYAKEELEIMKDLEEWKYESLKWQELDEIDLFKINILSFLRRQESIKM